MLRDAHTDDTHELDGNITPPGGHLHGTDGTQSTSSRRDEKSSKRAFNAVWKQAAAAAAAAATKALI